MRFTLDRSTRAKELTFGSDVFLRDAHRDRLSAFKAGARIEVVAILTSAKVGSAFRTGAF